MDETNFSGKSTVTVLGAEKSWQAQDGVFAQLAVRHADAAPMKRANPQNDSCPPQRQKQSSQTRLANRLSGSDASLKSADRASEPIDICMAPVTPSPADRENDRGSSATGECTNRCANGVQDGGEEEKIRTTSPPTT